MWNPFRPRNFSWGATLLTAEQVTAHLLAAFPAADIDLNDPEYMCLTENNLRDFVSKYQPRRGMRYAQPFPDCDDFALMAWGDILHGAYVREFQRAPLFGFIKLQQPQRPYHAENWGMTEHGVMLYEPQSGRWSVDYADAERVFIDG